jgi:hypothetical protein
VDYLPPFNHPGQVFWPESASRAAPEAACGAQPQASTERVRMPA